MKIVYAGTFLQEGLHALGHQLFAISLNRQEDLATQVTRACPEPDLVLLELLGGAVIVDPVACPFRTAVFCMDSCINEFWLSPYLRLFDDVFVDQRASVARLAEHGVNAQWLPLCISEHAFRKPVPLRHEVSFVGVINEERIKRSRLLSMLSRHMDVTIRQGITETEMLDLFAESKISLNENLFPGLTLRMLQVLASGSLLFTESNNRDAENSLKDGVHAVFYDATNILAKVEDVRSNYAKYKKIAEKGQRLCRERHTSTVRAMEFLAHMADKKAHNPRLARNERVLHYSMAKCLHGTRFGGDIAEAHNNLVELAKQNDLPYNVAGAAELTLGDIYARTNRVAQARSLYEVAMRKSRDTAPLMKLAMLHAKNGNTAEAAKLLTHAVVRTKSIPHQNRAVLLLVCNQEMPSTASLLFVIARLLCAEGKVTSLGFISPQNDPVPDSALCAALQAWDLYPDPEFLDLAIACLKTAGSEIALLPTLMAAFAADRLTDRHIRYVSDLAACNYDEDTAAALDSYLKTQEEAPPET